MNAPNIPNLPYTGGILLFIIGCFFMVLGVIQFNNWIIFSGMGVCILGLLIAWGLLYFEWVIDKSPSVDEAKQYAVLYIGLAVIIFLLSMILIGISLFKK